MGIGSVAGAFVAGVLTVLSPCVLPILPIVLSAAASERKYGPAALAAGLAVSFVAIGLFVATIGYSVGLTAELFRQIAAALMIVLVRRCCCRACRPAWRWPADRSRTGPIAVLPHSTAAAMPVNFLSA
jgi:cytochrome c biogenesis protein CcdA